jgi:hypothetical protein
MTDNNHDRPMNKGKDGWQKLEDNAQLHGLLFVKRPELERVAGHSVATLDSKRVGGRRRAFVYQAIDEVSSKRMPKFHQGFRRGSYKTALWAKRALLVHLQLNGRYWGGDHWTKKKVRAMWRHKFWEPCGTGNMSAGIIYHFAHLLA